MASNDLEVIEEIEKALRVRQTDESEFKRKNARTVSNNFCYVVNDCLVKSHQTYLNGCVLIASVVQRNNMAVLTLGKYFQHFLVECVKIREGS